MYIRRGAPAGSGVSVLSPRAAPGCGAAAPPGLGRRCSPRPQARRARRRPHAMALVGNTGGRYRRASAPLCGLLHAVRMAPPSSVRSLVCSLPPSLTHTLSLPLLTLRAVNLPCAVPLLCDLDAIQQAKVNLTLDLPLFPCQSTWLPPYCRFFFCVCHLLGSPGS